MDLFEVSGRDFCGYAEFKQPLYKQGLVWVGGVNKDSEAATSNGAGKTSMFKAISWCLWGECVDGDSGDKIIRRGTRGALVEVALREGDELWRVRRERKRGSPRLELIQPDGEAFKASKGDLQTKINELVGLDFHAFKNTVLYGQNDSRRFAHPQTRDSDRKGMLHRIMRTEVLVECAAVARKRANKLKAEIEADEQEANRLDAQIGEHDVAGLELEHETWEAQRLARVGELVERAKRNKANAEGWRAKSSKLPALRTREAELRAAIEASNKSQENADALKAAWDEAKRAVSTAELKQFRADEQAEMRREELERLKGGKCPTCTSPLTSGDGKKHRDGILAKLNEAEQESKKWEGEARRLQKQAKQAGEKWQQAQHEANVGDEAGDELEEVLDSIRDAESADERADEQLEAAREALKRAKDEKAARSPYEARLKEAQDKVQAYEQRKQELARGIEVRASELALAEFWARGFSGQGLPSFILDSVMPYITERTNHYLETLADGDITVNFSTQRELKSAKGEMRDEIAVTWVIEGQEDTTPSGGQLKKMEVAADLALMDLVATREGAHLDILMLDEVLDGLDSEGRQRVLRLLHELRSRRGSIFVISHETDMAEIFERSITVVKEGGVARLES